jgi:PKD repeat protein
VQLATFIDAGAADVHTAVIDWGDGATTAGTVSESTGSGTVSGSHSYSDDGSFTVSVTVTDDAGGADTDSLTITVSNVAPTVDAGPDQTASGGTVGLVTASFTDPGAVDTHTVTLDWGDGAVDNAATIVGSHQYGSAGTYTVTITVTDDDGGSGSDIFELEVLSAPTVVSIPSV